MISKVGFMVSPPTAALPGVNVSGISFPVYFPKSPSVVSNTRLDLFRSFALARDQSLVQFERA